jgi:hypothetical protein
LKNGSEDDKKAITSLVTIIPELLDAGILIPDMQVPSDTRI